MITQERLKQHCTYDPETGIFIALTNRCNNRYKKGDVLGTVSGSVGNQYLKAIIDGTSYGLHRLAWLYVHGVLPEKIDHINLDTMNNCISNLRPANNSQNGANRRKPSNNRSGVKGVSFRTGRGCWEANVIVDGVRKFRKNFKTLEEAEIAVMAAREQLHGEFANHG